MPRAVKTAFFLTFSLLGYAVAEAATVSSVAEHSDVLWWALGFLLTSINGWVVVALRGFIAEFKTMGGKVESLEHRATVLETRCQMNHAKKG